MRKDKDIKLERTYQRRIKDEGDKKKSMWSVVNPCFTDLAVTWQLRPAYCQDQASRLLLTPPNFNYNNHSLHLFTVLANLFQFRDTGLSGLEPILKHTLDRRQASPSHG